MVKHSVLMTVHDREPEVLLSTLRSLWRSGLADAEIIVVNDRSSLDYSWIREYAKPRFENFKWVDTGDYEGFRINGYGNPAHAFNSGLALVTGEYVVLMSSDVIVTPKVVTSLVQATREPSIYTPRIVDMESALEYCGASRFFPMPWFLAVPTKACFEVGGWDEAYLGGFCFEDNDLVGRLGLKMGKIKADWTVVAYHQSHVQPAYDISDPQVVLANAVNRDLTNKKWGGIPFDGEKTPFDVRRRPDPSGLQSLVFDAPGLLEKVVAKTTGTLAVASV